MLSTQSTINYIIVPLVSYSGLTQSSYILVWIVVVKSIWWLIALGHSNSRETGLIKMKKGHRNRYRWFNNLFKKRIEEDTLHPSNVRVERIHIYVPSGHFRYKKISTPPIEYVNKASSKPPKFIPPCEKHKVPILLEQNFLDQSRQDRITFTSSQCPNKNLSAETKYLPASWPLLSKLRWPQLRLLHHSCQSWFLNQHNSFIISLSMTSEGANTSTLCYGLLPAVSALFCFIASASSFARGQSLTLWPSSAQ